MAESLNLTNSLLVTVIGMLIVFFGLTVLIFLIKFLVALTGDRKKKSVAPIPQPVRPAPVAAEVAPSEVADEEVDNNELIAVITAAIASMMDNDTRFVVRHVRRIHRAPQFSFLSREDALYSHNFG